MTVARFEGQVALVTGAARGIGAAVARRLAADGATVWVTDIDSDGAAALAGAIGGRWCRLDVASEADWQAALAEVLARDGGLDILVNNAGITGLEDGAPHDPEHASLAEWRRVHAVNLDGVFLGCKYGVAAMRSQGRGTIVNISSRSGLVGIPMAAAYASSKAAVRNHSKSVALWCAGQGLAIRCNSVHPAAVLTPMWEPMLGDGPDRAERMAALVADTPLRRFGTAEEVAAMVAWLASDEAAYVTGAEFNIDGGLLAGAAAAPAPAD